MGMDVEFILFHGLKPDISWIKGGSGPQTGGPPLEPIWRHLFTWRRVLRTTMVPYWREIIPTKGFRAEIEKPVAPHTFLRMRRGAKLIRCGFTLRQYSTCSTSYSSLLYEVFLSEAAVRKLPLRGMAHTTNSEVCLGLLNTRQTWGTPSGRGRECEALSSMSIWAS